MPHTKPASFGIYTTRGAAEIAVQQLKQEGFTNSEISLLLPHKGPPAKHVTDTKAVEAAEVGATAGAILGGVLGVLADIGVLAIPGIGAFIIAGPVGMALISVGTFASIGGLWGALIGLGIPEEEAKTFEGRLHEGDILLSVHCDEPERIVKAKEIMVHTGAEDVYSRYWAHAHAHA